MTTLHIFPPRTRTRCCGTCIHWYVDRDATWCTQQRDPLPADLTACGCAAWRYEGVADDSRALMAALLAAGASPEVVADAL